MTARKLTRQDLHDAAEKFKNGGRWGPADEIGTLNYTQAEDIVAAARLVRKGKVISLALNFDQNGPQGAKSKYPSLGRINPVHTMLPTGEKEEHLDGRHEDGYPAGDAPGFSFETLGWIHRRQIAAVAADTWGCEVRPNETEPGINQPWHWITIPIMGLTMGEIFYLAELAGHCAADGVYEFMFVAPAIPITGAVGSPTNPLAIK